MKPYIIRTEVDGDTLKVIGVEEVVIAPPPPPPPPPPPTGGGEQPGPGDPTGPPSPTPDGLTFYATTDDARDTLDLGTLDDPWLLSSALGQVLPPGATLYLDHSRNYMLRQAAAFNFQFSGLPGSPISIRPWRQTRGFSPVRFDGEEWSSTTKYDPSNGPRNVYTVVLGGRYTHFYDFEVFSSSSETRIDPVLDGRGAPSLARTRGVMLTGKGNRLINSLIHNVGGSGIFIPGNAPVDAAGCEVYGTTIRDNGWYHENVDPKKSKGNGHAIYADGNPNPTLSKTFRHNVILKNFGDFGVQFSGSGGGAGYDVIENVFAVRSLVGSSATNMRFHANMLVNGATLQGTNATNSTLTANHSPADGDRIFVIPNVYDPDRLMVVIYNQQAKAQRVPVVLPGSWANRRVEASGGPWYGTADSRGLVEIPMDWSRTTVPTAWSSPLTPDLTPGFQCLTLCRV